MRVVRLATREFSAIDGVGAKLYGGRWNSPGRAVVYTASCAALAALESLAHLMKFPANMWLTHIEVPDTLKRETLKSLPADTSAFQQLGDEWLRANEAPIFCVPSVLVPSQCNYLLNPDHKLYDAIKIVDEGPFVFDPRLLSDIPA